jgi:PAS domain S-box-containing protein
VELFVSLNSFLLFLALAANLGLAVFVYLKNPRAETNRYFAYLLAAISFWVLSFLLFLNVKSLSWVLFLRRLTPVGSGLVAGFLLYFSLIFPRPSKGIPLRLKFLCLFPGILFSLLSIFTPWMIKSYQLIDKHYLFLGKPNFGWVYPFYSLYFVVYFLLGLGVLVAKYLRAQGKEQLQIFYVLFGMAVAGICAISVSLLLPLLGVPRLFTMGPPFTLIMAFFTTYAMVRYKLLDIDDFFRRGILFLFAAMAVAGTSALFIIGQTGFLFSFYVILANLTLGVFVLSQNPKSKINLSFFLITVAIVLWTIGVYAFWNLTAVKTVFLGGKIAFLGAALIPAFLFFFSLVFPRQLKPLSLWQWFMIIAPPVIFPFLIFSNLILSRVVSLAGGVQRVYGPAYPLFFFYFLIYLGFFFYDLFAKEKVLAGINRTQVRYVFLGFGVSAAIALTTNLLLPFLGWGAFSFVGPHASLVLVAFVSYAILKHRLMSIEIIIQRSTVYAAATILIMAFYVLAVMLSEIYLRQVMGYSSWLVISLAALLIAVAYQPLVRAFQNLTDRIFFRGRYDYQKTLRQISHEIASVMKLEELTRLIVVSFIDTMKVSEISFLLPEREGQHFRSIPLVVSRYKKIEIDVDSPIVTWLQATRDILMREEIEAQFSVQEDLTEKRKLEALVNAMERLGIPLWVPIIAKGELIGIIALGNKLSGGIFTSEDLTLLTTMANQTAIALDNARLYDEVLSMKNYSEEILQSITSGVLTADNRGRVLTYNYMAERISGKKAAEVIGKTAEEVWGKRGAIALAVEYSLQDCCYLNFETEIVSAERGLVPVAFSSILLRDGQGKKKGVLLSLHDLSERKELEDKIRRADKLTALATMAAGMAHEIKNPLSSMKVFSQLLPKKIDDPEFRRKLQEILPREIDRIDQIVEGLLGFARASTPLFEKKNIKEVLEDNLRYFAEKAKNTGVKIKKDYAELPEIEVDPAQISQVFSNLILNALQAMPEGGELLAKVFPGKKSGEVLQDIKIQVSDSGGGIPPERLKKLFDPFFTTKYGGTGLGLTIAHSIVNGHRGFIDVESKVGQGTTFTVTLPLHQ